MQALLQILATLSTGLFCGAAAYINLVEHPARMACGTELAYCQWQPSYRRATRMQASLALAGTLFGLLAWWQGASVAYLLGSLALFAVVPFTFIVIMPVNKALQQADVQTERTRVTSLLARWDRLHAFRTLFSLLAFLILIAG